MDMEKKLQKWIKRIQKKSDPVASNDLVTYYYKEIYAYVYKKTLEKELSMDLTQEIFMNMLETISQFDEQKARFRTWLYQIARYRIVDYYRSKSHRQQAVIEILEDDSHETESFLGSLLTKFKLEEIESFIDTLGEQRQAIFWLKIVEQKSFNEIAERLKISESTIKTRFYATMKLVKNEFGGIAYE